MYTTYILYSETTTKYYVGQTNDLEGRVKRHNSGENSSTKHGVPWIILWSEVFETRSAAVLKERKIKGRGAQRFLEELNV
jgi:putative endonuclease